jgi:hypothetical protein
MKDRKNHKDGINTQTVKTITNTFIRKMRNLVIRPSTEVDLYDDLKVGQ